MGATCSKTWRQEGGELQIVQQAETEHTKAQQYRWDQIIKDLIKLGLDPEHNGKPQKGLKQESYSVLE